MRRGNTEIISFTLPFDCTNARLYFTFSQGGVIKFEKTNEDDMTIEKDTISISLTQLDTLKLLAPALVNVQCRYIFEDGTSGASGLVQLPVADIKKDGEIRWSTTKV